MDKKNEKPNENQNLNLNNLYNPQHKMIKGEFFILDQPKDPFKRLWNKNSKNFPSDLGSLPVIHKYELIKFGKKFRFLKRRIYFFTFDYIYYKQVLFFNEKN